MGALRSRDQVLCRFGHRHGLRRGSHRDYHGFGADHFQPMAPDMAAWPIAPHHREIRGRLRGDDQRWRGEHLVGRDRPKNGADLPWFERRGGLLAVVSKRTRTAMAQTSAIDNAQRAIPFRSA
jgi:hypothetical protein